MIEVIPSILTNDPRELSELIQRCEGVVERVSIDIIDGKFADNKTIDPSILTDIDTNLKLDFQLMVYEPINWVEKCASVGADRIIGHIEHMTSQIDFVGKVQSIGAYVGLGVDLDSPVSKLDPTILNNLDVVLLMSVSAGFGGQKFNSSVLKKVNKLDKIRVRDDTPFQIQIDGGVTPDNIEDIRKARVDEVSIGRSLFKGDLAESVKRFQKAAY